MDINNLTNDQFRHLCLQYEVDVGRLPPGFVQDINQFYDNMDASNKVADMDLDALVGAHPEVFENQPEFERRLRAVLRNYGSIPTVLRQRLVKSTERIKELEEELGVDHLTGLYNRKRFDNDLSKAIEGVGGRRESDPEGFWLLMVDIDGFKKFNDTYGHLTGDDVLRKVSSIMRAVGSSYRYGGEEMAMFVFGSRECGPKTAEKVRLGLDESTFKVDGERVPLTVSVGLEYFPFDTKHRTQVSDELELIHRADKALYAAKVRGKNQVHVYGTTR